MIDFSVRFPRSIHIITALSVLAVLICIAALVFSGAGLLPLSTKSKGECHGSSSAIQ